MTDELKIFVENLKDTIKAIEKLSLISLAASVGLLVLWISNPTFSPTGASPKIPVVGGEGPPTITASLMLFVYFFSGALLFLYYRSAERIMGKLRGASPAILEAVMSYPSVVTLSPLLRCTAIMLLGLLGIAPIFLMTTREKAVLVSAVIGAPYLVLLGFSLWRASQQPKGKH